MPLGDSSLHNSEISEMLADQYSHRSKTSKSSINNPKLVETVEDAIRRLVLPEPIALKSDEEKRDYSRTRRQSDLGSRTDSTWSALSDDDFLISGNSVEVRKDKNRNIDPIETGDPPQSFERETLEETVSQDGQERTRIEISSDNHRGLEAAALGAGTGPSAAGVQKDHSQEALERKERQQQRRRVRYMTDDFFS